jgi:hypothetical protein
MGVICNQSFTGLSVTDDGDFFQLRSVANVLIIIHEIRVYQTSDTTLAMNGIEFNRGTGGAAGNALTENKWNIGNPTVLGTAFSLATTDVGSIDLTMSLGWNILQEFLWLPTPQFRIELAAADHFGISLVNTDTLTIGGNVVWEEIAT